MDHTDACGGSRGADLRTVSVSRAGDSGAPIAEPEESCRAASLVHIVDGDDTARRLLTNWLTAAGLRSRAYTHLGAFLKAHRADVPGCLVIDAQPCAISGLELQAILLPLTLPCPIVMMSGQSEATLVGNAMKRGALDFVKKPLHEQEVVGVISSAIKEDRQRRLIATHRAELRARFATLSPRERQVMALVTAGLLNKQVGAELGVSEITVKAHRGAAMRKMAARSLVELVRMADAIRDDVGSSRSGQSPQARNDADAGRHSGYSLVPRTRAMSSLAA